MSLLLFRSSWKHLGTRRAANWILGAVLTGVIGSVTAPVILAYTCQGCCWMTVDRCTGCFRILAENYIWLGVNNFEYKCQETSTQGAHCDHELLTCWSTSGAYPVYNEDTCSIIHHWNQGPATLKSMQCTLFYGNDDACPWL